MTFLLFSFDAYMNGDYLKRDDGERWELINGIPYNMSPAPQRLHQKVLGALHLQLGNQLKGKTCEVYIPPFDARLPMGSEKEEDIINVVQPDITVICNPKKLDKKGCIGTPDFIIEIISPGNPQQDKLEKFNLYEIAGVKEYWLISPDIRMLEVFLLGSDGTYGRPQIYTEKDTIKVNVLKKYENRSGRSAHRPRKYHVTRVNYNSVNHSFPCIRAPFSINLKNDERKRSLIMARLTGDRRKKPPKIPRIAFCVILRGSLNN